LATDILACAEQPESIILSYLICATKPQQRLLPKLEQGI
jgi:hypothetical protein